MKLKITNLPRFILSVAIVFGLITGISMIINKPTLSHGDNEYEAIYVSSGDTLWSIAENQKQDNLYYEDRDIRYIVDNIKDINELKTSSLKIGQELLIPVF